jgi:hypothetical protein
MIKEPEDEAFEELEKAQQRNALLVDKGCAERGCMGYDSRDGDAPVEMVIQRPWVDLTRRQIQNVYFAVLEEHRGGHQMQGQLAFGEALQAAIKEKNT